MTSATLLDAVAAVLQAQPGTHTSNLTVLRSVPRRSHALFPYATLPLPKIHQEEILFLLSSSASVPLLGIELHIYTIPSSDCTIIYLSKLDTTFLPADNPQRPPTAKVATAILSHLIATSQTSRTRIHLFARPATQYLFPGSADNPKKKVLTDKELVRWWKATLSLITAPSGKQGELKKVYSIPTLSQAESLAFIPASTTSNNWVYGNPFAVFSPPLSPLSVDTSSGSTPSLGSLIPSFPDDPKSRFINSLTSSSLPSAGSAGDWDENPLGPKDREREKERLDKGVPGGCGEFWERLEYRQECCAGALVGFFGVSWEPNTSQSEASKEVAKEVVPHPEVISSPKSPSKRHVSENRPQPHPYSIPYATYIPLWSTIHNLSYDPTSFDSGNLEKACRKWEEDVRKVVALEGHKPSTAAELDQGTASRITGENEWWRTVEVKNPEKRPREEAVAEVGKPEVKKINLLMVRKKKKVD